MAQSRAAKNLLLEAYGPGRELSRIKERDASIKKGKEDIKNYIKNYSATHQPNPNDAYNKAMQNAFKNTKVFGIGVGP